MGGLFSDFEAVRTATVPSAQVEHQWSQTKAKLPSLKAKFGEADRRRATLADLARRLKAHIRDATRGGQLPRLLLNHLDPMERQALEDL